MKNMFDAKDVAQVIERINKLRPETQAKWGTMSVDQMLAHCNVTYDMDFTGNYPKPNSIAKFMLKLFVKNTVVGDKPYKKNTGTAPQFKMKGKKDYAAEKAKLIDYITKVQQLGIEHYEGRESNSFGALTGKEWNNMFYKHLDHHLTQFGV